MAQTNNISLKRESFQRFGNDVKLFEGVKDWFARINSYGRSKGLDVKHYIISSGLKEMIEGTAIAEEFEKIFACSFLYNVDGVAYWPAVAVNYTTKTQFLYKINKGVESVSDSRLVNRYVPEEERPLPFSRMIYVGDGTTDIPSMRQVKYHGGHSIAVYDPSSEKGREVSEELIAQGRVSHICPADYREGRKMDTIVKTIIDKIYTDHQLKLLAKERDPMGDDGSSCAL